MDYGYAGLEMMLISIEAERALAYERGRWIREYQNTIVRREMQNPRRARLISALRALTGTSRRRLRPARRITRAVQRVAGSIRAIGAAD